MAEPTADLLITGGRIYAPSEPFADSLLISQGRIAWIGQREAANVSSDADVLDVAGGFVAPGFVDAHVHATGAGEQLIGLDLSHVRSARELLALIEAVTRRSRGAPIIGHGWDESTWENPVLPSRTEIDRASFGSIVYLTRVDVHSALISSTAALTVSDASRLSGWSEAGPIYGAAHGHVREVLLKGSASRTASAQSAFIDHCLKHGVVSIHECAGPQISSEGDFQSLLGMRDQIDVVGYWGEFGQEGVDRARDLGAHGVGGDLFIDGSFGSHSALLCEAYADVDSTGIEYLDAADVAEHLRLASKANLQAGFHAIGDRALRYITEALLQLRDEVQLRPLRHRVEHAELVTPQDLEVWRDAGVTASVQPLFDSLWSKSMYVSRLGRVRAAQTNPLADMQSAGVLMAFGSDAPVTASKPWEWIRAAIYHSQPSQRLTARAAFNAATRGGRRAVHQDDAGVIAVGATADLAVWRVEDFTIQTPDPRVAAWSTDERAGVPELPLLSEGGEVPECLATIISGRIRYRHGL